MHSRHSRGSATRGDLTQGKAAAWNERRRHPRSQEALCCFPWIHLRAHLILGSRPASSHEVFLAVVALQRGDDDPELSLACR